MLAWGLVPAECFVRGLLALISLVYLLLLGWHLGQIVLGVDPVGWLGLVRELTLYLFLPAPVFLLLALLFRARGALLVSLVPLALLVALYHPRFVPRGQAATNGPAFRVMTFNAGAGARDVDFEAILAVLQEANADVLALQELPRRTLPLLESALADRYPYRASTMDVATFSVFPISDAVEVRLARGTYTSQAMDLLVGDRLVRLTNVHLLRAGPPIIGRRSALRFARSYDADLVESQVTELVERYIRPVAETHLLAGDFNQTEWTRAYERITALLTDGFATAGRGLGHTYPTVLDLGRSEIRLPLVRIDYIFHSADLTTLNAQVGPDGGSDHLPVVADIAFR